MNNLEFSQLINICNQCKNIGNYNLANSAFAVALENLSGKDTGILIETDDETGEYTAYYDLITIVTPTNSACIPTPLLSTLMVAQMYKAGRIVDREVHNRQVNYIEDDDEYASLVSKLESSIIELAGARKVIANACISNLAVYDDDGENFSGALYDYWVNKQDE